MIFLLHSLFLISFVWMMFHFWRQLPLVEHETGALRFREFIEWSAKGVAVPLLIWIVMNLGMVSWIPPFLPQIDAAKNAGSFSLWTALRYTSPAMSVIVSYWAGLSLIVITLMIRQRTEDRSDFNSSFLIWSGFTLPLGVLSLWITGWIGAGFALVVWLAPIVYGTLPSMRIVKRAPSYAQAIAKIKFGKYSEAEWEVIKELEACENDFNGWMMLAELYAVHFRDFKQAEQTVIDLCEQPDISPSNVCVALHRLADWYLQLENDPQGARRCMEAIGKRFPNTHLAKMARLRLNRIPRTREEWIEENRAKPLPLPARHGELLDEGEAPVDIAVAQHDAEVLSQSLSADPNDVAAREQFARALARLGKLQPAIEQIDLLLNMEGQMTTNRAKWLSLKSAWMHRSNPKDPELRNLLKLIIQEFPHSSQAVAAQRRIFLIEEQARVARYAGKKKKSRIVVRLDDTQKSRANRPLEST